MVVYNTEWNSLHPDLERVVQRRSSGHILTVAYAGSAGVNLLGRQQFNAMYNPTPELIQAIADNGFSTASVPTAVR
jgi:hypothetical protein